MIEELKYLIAEKEKEVEERDHVLERNYSRIAWFRIVFFLGFVILLYMGLTEDKPLLTWLSLALFVLFFVLVKVHSVITKERKKLDSLRLVLKNYEKRASDNRADWSKLDSGKDLIDHKDTLSYDIDLVGRGSLFQLISIAHTEEGRKRLADTLTLTENHVKEADDRYDAIQELKEHFDFLADFEAMLLISQNVKKKDEEVDPVQKFPSFVYGLMVIIPLINIVTILMIALGNWKPLMLLGSFIVGLILADIAGGYSASVFAKIANFGEKASRFEGLLKEISNVEFQSKILKDVKNRIQGEEGIEISVKKLNRLAQATYLSYNPVVDMILNGFLGWNYYLGVAGYKWLSKHENIVDELTDCVSEIEELGSLAVLSLIRKTVKPEITFDKTVSIQVANVNHPLIPPTQSIANSCNLTHSVNVITGSNMSGKTTFMRSIAMNLVLAYAGAGVTADSMKIPYVKIFTSMRVKDDVTNRISTFYAEILRIKSMAEYKEKNEGVPAIFLIDEIFKGTNSADRIVGATEAIKKLQGKNTMVIVTTHDFELCDIQMEDGTFAQNYHFEDQFTDDKLAFDYKIKDGKCTTRNAVALLKMAGLMTN